MSWSMRLAEFGSDMRERLTFRGRVSESVSRRGIAIAGAVIAAALLLYYPIGMIWIHKISDQIDFVAEPAAPEGGAHAVAMAAALVDREINENRWTANDPFFMPSSALDNMPNYQQGIIGAVARFAFELTDQLGRTRGSSQTDSDLQEAAGLLQYSGTKWVWDPSISLMPTAASEQQYQKAITSLRRYNQRLAGGSAVFERRGDNLLATLDRIALDIGSSSAVLDQHVSAEAGSFIDLRADDLFYGIKGQNYAYYMLLRELGRDFENVIRERELNTAWAQMLDSMRKAASLDPGVVINGSPDGQFMPSHLVAQGFYLLRARTQLREITNILLK